MQTDTKPLDLVVVSVKETAARCRVVETSEAITLRASGLWRVVPGEIVTVQPRKRWTYARHPYLSGEITASRIDAPGLGLTPLRLEDRGVWNPDEEYWGEEDEPLPEYARRIIERGLRSSIRTKHPQREFLVASNEPKICQSASNFDPRSASKTDPLVGG